MASLDAKVFAVTGASSGIGLACATTLAARGASLALADINVQGLEQVARSLDHQGRNITIHQVDVRSRDNVRDFIDQVKQQHGLLHGCANVAGVIGKGSNILPIWEVSSEEYSHTMDVNAKGVFNCIAEQLRPDIMQKGGSIVNIASVAGILGLPKNAPYSASKHAVVGLTKAGARDAAELGIRVNCVAPGAVMTPMVAADKFSASEPTTPIKRFALPEEVANIVCFLLSDESSFVTGSTYTVDGGWTC